MVDLGSDRQTRKLSENYRDIQQSIKLLVYDLISSYFRQPIKLIRLQYDPSIMPGRASAAV